MRVLVLAAIALLLACQAACGGGGSIIPPRISSTSGHPARVEAISIWPDNPVAGQIVEVTVHVVPATGDCARLGSPVDVQYRARGGSLYSSGFSFESALRTAREGTIEYSRGIGPASGVRWTLPFEPGTYTLQASLPGGGKSLNLTVCDSNEHDRSAR